MNSPRSSSLRPLVLTLLFVIVSASARAADDADQYWSGAFAGPGTGGAVHALATWNGLLVAGGAFTTAGSRVAQHVAAWDGSEWLPLGEGLGATVNALAVYNGDLIAGGEFTVSGRTLVSHIARWDGAAWQPLDNGVDAPVLALAVHDGALIAGGAFHHAGNRTALGVARWDSTGWAPVGSGLGDAVQALADFGGDLYAGGSFTGSGGAAVAGVARWDGAAWVPLGSGLSGTSPVVLAFADWNGRLVIAGQFAGAGGIAGANIGEWDGAAWAHLAGPPLTRIEALSTFQDSVLVAGGNPAAGGNPPPRLFRFGGTGGWAQLGGVDGPVHALLDAGGAFYAAGDFDRASTTTVHRVARWAGSAWVPVGPADRMLDDAVTALGVQSDTLFVGGFFQRAGGVADSTRFVAAWTGDHWLRLGDGLPDVAWALTSYALQIVAASRLSTVNGRTASRVTTWNGSTWTDIGKGFNDNALALTVNNGLVCAGQFTTADSLPASRAARWSNSAWSGLGAGLDGPVWALASYKGSLHAGGSFAGSGGAPMPWVARWDSGHWWPLPVDLDGPVLAFTVYDGLLIAGGTFQTAGGQPAANVAAWDGVQWHSLGGGVDNTVRALAVYNGELIAGGEFNVAGNRIARYIARWNGSSWSPLGSGMDNAVTSLAVAGGALFAGGYFRTAGDKSSPGIARWNGPPVPVEPGSFTAAWDGDAALLRWTASEDAGGPAGYLVDREAGAGVVRLTGRPIVGSSGVTTFRDPEAPAAGARYWLIELSRGGSMARHGPAVLPPRSAGAFPDGALHLAARENPFRSGTTLEVDLPVDGACRLDLFDVRGALVRHLLDGALAAGPHAVPWDGRDGSGRAVAAGVYVARLEIRGVVRTLKLQRVR